MDEALTVHGSPMLKNAKQNNPTKKQQQQIKNPPKNKNKNKILKY